ncbi:MAG: CRTAC1 family protein [Pirellula sp.]|jgi:hypothetical protein|nr:CRTAC1 family protein [Pirellula sp.]
MQKPTDDTQLLFTQRVRALSIAFCFLLTLNPCNSVGLAFQANKSQPSDHSMRFTDAQPQSGVDFEHFNGRTGKYFLVETIASGFATFDYDQDGWIDLYLLNGDFVNGYDYSKEIASKKIAEEWRTKPPRSRLYRNVGGWRFVDVTESSGLDHIGLSVGATVADVNNDGYPEVFVCNHGINQLYWNRGDGTFEADLSNCRDNTVRTAGGASFLDIDNDSNLDLFVANYIKFDVQKKIVRTIFGVEASAGPLDYPPDGDSLFLSQGDGSFADISQSSGVSDAPKTGMGTIAFDFDRNGHQDVFVCNDSMVNQLFLNQGNRTFSDEALLSGVAYNYAGATMASMGVDCGDYDNDGKLDLVISNFEKEVPVLYRGQGDSLFDDVAVLSGLGIANRTIKWGIALTDLNNDSFLDVYIACGHLIDTANRLDDTTNFASKNILLMGTPERRFVDVTESSGPGLQEVKVSRGVCVDDLDNDGLLDVVVLNSNSQPTILKNDSTKQNHWVRVRTVGTTSNRDGIGALVKVRFGESERIAGVFSGRGYQSYYGRDVHFGLGKHSGMVDIEIVWPSGVSKVYHNLAVDKLHTLYE